MLIVIVVSRKPEELNSLLANLIIINIDVLSVNLLLSIKSYHSTARNVSSLYKMQFISPLTEPCSDKYYRLVALCYAHTWQLYLSPEVVYLCLNLVTDWFLCFRHGSHLLLLRFCSQTHHPSGIRGGNYLIIPRCTHATTTNRGDTLTHGLETKITG